MVAVAQGKGTAKGVQQVAVEFLATDDMTRWMSAALNGGS
jgi:ribosomal protein S28E/S33